MTARRALGPAAILIVGLLPGGCATGSPGTMAGRFVQPAVPPAPELAESGGSVAPAAGPRRPVEAASSGALAATIEDADPHLAAALLIEAARPTAENHLRVAEQYRRLGVLDAAYDRLLQAVDKSPRLVAGHLAIARLWRDWGMPERGLSAAHRARVLDEDSAAVHNMLGTLLDALGQLEAAREAYQRAALSEPTAGWALNNLCYVEFRLARLDEARLLCEAALRLAPDLLTAHNNLAMVHAASGDLPRARAEFFAAGDPAVAHYNVGIVHLAAGDYAAAAAAFEAAIAARPSFTAAKARAHAARLRLLTGSH